MSKGVGRGVGTHNGTAQLFHRGGVTTAQRAGTTTHTPQINWQTHTSKQLLPAGTQPSKCLFVIAFCLVTLQTRGSSCYWKARIFIKLTLYEKCVWWRMPGIMWWMSPGHKSFTRMFGRCWMVYLYWVLGNGDRLCFPIGSGHIL